MLTPLLAAACAFAASQHLPKVTLSALRVDGLRLTTIDETLSVRGEVARLVCTGSRLG